MLSRVGPFATPWTIDRQAPLFMRLSRQKYWSGLPFPLSVGLPNPGIEPASPMSPASADGFFTTEPPGKPVFKVTLGQRTKIRNIADF